MKITVGKLRKKTKEHRASTPEERLDLVEQLRIQSGRFLFSHLPSHFSRLPSPVSRLTSYVLRLTSYLPNDSGDSAA